LVSFCWILSEESELIRRLLNILLTDLLCSCALIDGWRLGHPQPYRLYPIKTLKKKKKKGKRKKERKKERPKPVWVT
jgi:hypothetical protein